MILQRANPSGAFILKPCKITGKGVPFGHVARDGASATLARDSCQGFSGAYRRDGRVRELARYVAKSCSNRPVLCRIELANPKELSHVTNGAGLCVVSSE